MKKMYLLAILALTVAPMAMAEDWTNVPIVDTKCSMKAKADPDAHARSCALACAKSGFGIVDRDGHYLKFDQKGNQEALKQLQSSSKKDHLRVNVSGQKDGETIHVESVKLL